jgi:hypothetical protein
MAPPSPGPAREPGRQTMTMTFTKNRNDAGHSRQDSRSPHCTREPTKRPERPIAINLKAPPIRPGSAASARSPAIQQTGNPQTAAPVTSIPHRPNRPKIRA